MQDLGEVKSRPKLDTVVNLSSYTPELGDID
jgi:hypothetical protein